MVIALLALTACDARPPVDKVPLSGKITLEYVGITQPDGSVEFTLANGTSKAIHFLGFPDPAPRGSGLALRVWWRGQRV